MSLAVLRGYRGCQKFPGLALALRGLRCESTNGVQNCHTARVGSQKSCLLNGQPEGLTSEEQYLSARLGRLSLSPTELNISMEYILPTTAVNLTIQKGHIFNNKMHQGVIDCPTRLGSVSFIVPESVVSISEPGANIVIEEPSNQPAAGKFAKNVLKIRRRKMNRHRLKKLRKRMKFLNRKRLHRKRKLKEEKVQAEFRAIMKRAEDFDPAKFVQENLEQARKGGFRVDIFASQRQRN